MTTRKAARAATARDELPLGQVQLLGTYGAAERPLGLVRLPDGRTARVTVGTRIGSARITALGQGQAILSGPFGDRRLEVAG
ncbi:MAG: hypothetical protein ACU0CO_11060 [Shimia sp.]